MNYIDTVSFDVRVTVLALDMPFVVEYLEEFFESEGYSYEYPNVEGMPYEHTLPGFEQVGQIIGD